MATASLEYRLYKGLHSFEPLFHYDSIELDQILTRRECEFFVKDGITYQQTSSAIEENLHLIYVKKVEESEKEKEVFNLNGRLTLEIREFNLRENHPIIQKHEFDQHLEILSQIGSVYLYFDQMEWERDSAEIDEDRLVYVLYMIKTGYKLEGY
ncbi:hypothetical protein [Paenisporosarcina quisquiliarum]|uniref:hypothetical protein n=1 Tax=Paenisporosarcina quisquiliarum TaxID=365346 RepID=UPI003736CD9D